MSENESQKNALSLVFDAHGLIPVIAQDHLTGEVRMFAFASTEAVLATLATKRATFFSRSRGEIWEKGKTSGHTLAVKSVYVDCDSDALIYAVEPNGPTCHTGAETCFFQTLDDDGARDPGAEGKTLMSRLEARLEARRTSTSEKSYTKSLYEGGPVKIGEKVREEAGELARAIAEESADRVASEAADVVYHLLVGLRARGIEWRAVLAKLEERLATSGHAEKASRTE